jgi:hypothetical protein
MKASATSTANNGMASRAKVLRDPIGADADPLGGAEGSGLQVAIRGERTGGAATPLLSIQSILSNNHSSTNRATSPDILSARQGSRRTNSSSGPVSTPLACCWRVATGLSNPSPMTAASPRQTGCASCSVWVSHPPIIAQTFEDPNHAAAAKLTRRALRHRECSCLHPPGLALRPAVSAAF